MTDIIIHKHSTTAGDPPTAAEVDLGELAIQAADGHIYLKRTDGAVVRVTMLPGGGEQQVLYKTGSGDYALGWGTISSTLMGGTLWSEVIAEVQSVFALVEGTASVLLSASATLTAGSTGPLTVSVADANYLTDGTSITGVLGTVYGTLSRSGSTYSFVSNQSYVSDVTFSTGTRFAAAFLNDTFNPLRIGSAQVEDDNSYTDASGYSHAVVDSSGRIAWGIKKDGSFAVASGNIDLDDAKVQEDTNFTDGSGYLRAEVDVNGRIAWGIKSDGSVAIKKALIEGNSTVEGNATIKGDLTVQGTTVTIDVTNLTIEDNTILLNKGESGSGVTLGSAGIEIDRGTADNVKLEWNETNQAWTAEESIKTNDSLFISGSYSKNDNSYTDVTGYSHAVVDSFGRIGYGLKNDGSFSVASGNIDLDDAKVQEDTIFTDASGYSHAVVDSFGRIGYGLKNDGTFAVASGSVSLDSARIEEDIAFASGSEYLRAEVDANNRIAWGIKKDGSFTIQGDLIIQGIIRSVNTGSVVADDSALYESRLVGNQLHIIKGQNGLETQLTTVGDNYNVSFTTETPQRLIFLSTRSGEVKPTVMSKDGSNIALAAAPKTYALWGDSLTANLRGIIVNDGHNYMSRAIKNEFGTERRVVNSGVGGQTSIQISARSGGIAVDCTVQGGQIPASGSVALTSFYPDLLFNPTGDGVINNFQVKIAGIQGTLTRVDATNYTFTRATAGSAVAASGTVSVTVLTPDNNTGHPYTDNSFAPDPFSSADLNEYTAIFWYGHNGVHTGGSNVGPRGETQLSCVQGAVNALLNVSKRFLVLPQFNATAEQGTTAYQNLQSNRWDPLETAFPDNWYDIRADFIAQAKTWMQANYPAAYASEWGEAFTAADPGPTTNGDSVRAINGTDSDYDVANDMIPRALRGDTVHLNSMGSTLFSQLLAAKLDQLNW